MKLFCQFKNNIYLCSETNSRNWFCYLKNDVYGIKRHLQERI